MAASRGFDRRRKCVLHLIVFRCGTKYTIVSMVSAEFFDLLEALARKIRRKKDSFGGIQVGF